MAGVHVKTWCMPALNNKKKPEKLSWVSGDPLPPALALSLPFRDASDPAAAVSAKSAGARRAAVGASTAALLALSVAAVAFLAH